MKLGTVAIFVPDELLVLVLIGGGIAWIICARKLATSMFAFVVLSFLLPPLLAPIIQMLPTWVLWVILGYVIFMIPFIAVSIFQGLVSPVLGRQTTNEMGGHLAADVARAMIVGPFKLIGVVFRLIMKLWSRQ